MIHDKLSNLGRYITVVEGLDTVCRFIENTDLRKLPAGHTFIDGNRIYLNHFCYDTAADTADCVFEAHRRYVDVHVTLRGSERIGITPAEELVELREYDEESDGVLLQGIPRFQAPVTVGEFMLVNPGEGHMTRLMDGVCGPVEKAVFKILL